MYRRLGPDTAAAGEGGRRERWAMRVISPISLKVAVSPPGGGEASAHLASERESMSGSREIAEQRFVVRTHCTAAGYNSTADRACGM